MASQRQQGHLLSHISAGFTVGLCLTGKTAQPPELEAQGCLEATFVHHGHHLLPLPSLQLPASSFLPQVVPMSTWPSVTLQGPT